MESLDTLEAIPSPKQEKFGFLEAIYHSFFNPITLFQGIADEPQAQNHLLLYSVLLVFGISAMTPLLVFASTGGELSSLVFWIPWQAIGGTLGWLLIGSMIGLAAYAFTGRAHLKTLLILSALSTLPWIWMAPITLFKNGLGFAGGLLAVCMGLGVWLWSTFLFALAIGTTYKLTLERTLLVLFLPFSLFWVSIAWVFSFFINLKNLIS